jgi:nickel/cobalt transporter (NicO) family protein
VMGISVTCLGIWLLLQRLSGRADHIHLGGGHDHHHHHGPAETSLPPVRAASLPPDRAASLPRKLASLPRKRGEETDRRLRLGGIILLGINGGLIPCWDAVAILVTVAGTGEFWLVLPALLAFSAGLAAVLVAIGIMVVQIRNFAGSKWGEGKFVRMLPLLSSVVVTCMGLYLCFASLPRNLR